MCIFFYKLYKRLDDKIRMRKSLVISVKYLWNDLHAACYGFLKSSQTFMGLKRIVRTSWLLKLKVFCVNLRVPFLFKVSIFVRFSASLTATCAANGIFYDHSLYSYCLLPTVILDLNLSCQRGKEGWSRGYPPCHPNALDSKLLLGSVATTWSVRSPTGRRKYLVCPQHPPTYTHQDIHDNKEFEFGASQEKKHNSSSRGSITWIQTPGFYFYPLCPS